MDAKSLANTRSKLLSLDQHGNQVSNHLDIGAIGKMLPGVRAGTSRALFESDDAQFVAQSRLRLNQLLCGSRVA